VAEAEEHARRQRLEENLRQSEERFRIMANAIPQLAWMARADGHIYWYNRRCFEYTGAAGHDLEGWGWQSVVAPEALPRVLEQWKASIAAGQPLEMVFPLRGVDGRFRRFLTRVQPLKDAQGRVVQWFGTNTDVEELKRAEQRLRATFDNAAAGMVETDDQDCFVAVNGRLCQMLGYRREELLGRSTLELTDPEDRPRS
jgi:PAS domain S-box-containing protein